MEPTSWPKILILAGIVLLLVGILAWALQGRLDWLGRLPGDIRIERDNFRMYIPLTTMILLSLIFNAIFWVLRRIFG